MSETYFSAWYSKNKARWNAKRRQRYESDPEYRKRVLSQKSHEKHDPAPAPWTREEAQSVSETCRRLAPRLMSVGGKLVLCYSSGALLDRIRISYSTLLDWERKGLIPQASSVDSGKRRWYTEEYLKRLGLCVAHGRRERWTGDRFRQEVAKLFKEEFSARA